MKIKNWQDLQHFRDRQPIWIKLYRNILDQRDISLLSDRSFRVLIGLWLLASEDKTLQGILPDIPDIAFRLRMTEKQITESLQDLTEWVEQDDINPISERYQDDTLEKRREEERKEYLSSVFESLWNQYPRKDGKKAAAGHFNASVKSDEDVEKIQKALNNYTREVAGKERRYIKNGSSWFNNWQDWVDIDSTEGKIENYLPRLS